MTRINEHMIHHTPEVHDCEWEPELDPRRDETVKLLAILGPLVIGITAFLYAGREIVTIVSGWLS
ncbi:MAG TPA: hypothetical protein DD397_06585 [Hyphomonas sp.]|jgi:hypothetical protein|uniref:hypothetical protein n=1 Tax=Hyphomonas sp. TaxID=87 RepID=UPI000E8FD4BA|nr:hypothetical protein [Hyphomonas sp.]QDP49120.1 MAG: hypothetical protein Unbinned4811contig1001_65 [Prokaryotic dsDNA virus sp.]HBN92212.1 hypothetical protein [Hyphomonas sp.]|tara:strand:- start:38590 stop:38784 length:195 start_codon:yes stop_codon:yes gene_type:complete